VAAQFDATHDALTFNNHTIETNTVAESVHAQHSAQMVAHA
jgi:hypothetical protein